jgi:DNA-3-methyladenine glycosylase II
MTADLPDFSSEAAPAVGEDVHFQHHVVGARLTQRRRALEHLSEEDPVLRGLSTRYGHADPFDWDGYGRTDHDRFRTLAFLVIGQAVTRDIATEQYDKVTRTAGAPLTADNVARLDRDGLAATGLARFKVDALSALSGAITENRVDLDDLDELKDDQVCSLLTEIHGIGRWAVELFLIRGLHRPDVLPASDYAIRRAVQRAWSLAALPSPPELDALAGRWRPYRSFASGLLWASLTE